jgi:hypothetical protein
MALNKQSKVGLSVGGAFTALVVGLLVFLHGSTAEVPHLFQPLPPGHRILLCRDAPQPALDALNRAMAYGEAHGIKYGPVQQDGCAVLCNHEGRFVPCTPGAITVSLRDTAFDENHCGETVWAEDRQGRITWATILLPERCFAPEDEAKFPKDYYALTLTHELVIHAEGRGHTKTAIVKGVAAEKTGELANAQLEKMGWGDEGL